jgi:hypothetical protein
MSIGFTPMDMGCGPGEQKSKRDTNRHSNKNKNKHITFQSNPPFFMTTRGDA